MSELKQAMKRRKVQSVPSHLKPATQAERDALTAFQKQHAPAYWAFEEKKKPTKSKGVY